MRNFFSEPRNGVKKLKVRRQPMDQWLHEITYPKWPRSLMEGMELKLCFGSRINFAQPTDSDMLITIYKCLNFNSFPKYLKFTLRQSSYSFRRKIFLSLC